MGLKKILLILLMLSIYLLPQLNADEPQKKPRDFIMGNVEFMKKALGLNDDQMKKISTIMLDSLKQIQEKHLAVERAMIDVREELLKDNPDLNKIKASIDKKSTIMADIEFITIQRDLNIKSVLTPDQFLKWKSLRKPEPSMFFGTPFPPRHHPDGHFMGRMR